MAYSFTFRFGSQVFNLKTSSDNVVLNELHNAYMSEVALNNSNENEVSLNNSNENEVALNTGDLTSHFVTGQYVKFQSLSYQKKGTCIILGPYEQYDAYVC